MIRKRLLALSLILALLASFAGCRNVSNSGGSTMEGEDVVLWGESATAKIVLDDDGKAASASADKKVITISMARNEEEGAQLMLYAKQDIPHYTVSVSDLVCGSEKILSGDIDVYMLKYQSIDDSTGKTFPDYYGHKLPDPMLPFETAVAYGENTVKQGNNQAVFFDVSTTKDTPAGRYTGTVTVTTQVQTYQVPMEVTVYDVTLPDTSELKTYAPYFGREAFESAELDGSDEMAILYTEVLMEYNMSSIVPGTDEVMDLPTYLERLKTYYNYPGFNTYRIEFDTTSGWYDGELVQFNVGLLRDYVVAIGEMSVTDKVNYLSKAFFYPYDHVDEPQTEAQFETARASLSVYRKMLADADEILRAKYAGTEDYAYYEGVVSETLMNMPYMLTCNISGNTLASHGLGEATICIVNDFFNNASDLRQLKEGREDMELWTYVCCTPFYPHANYAFDSPAVGTRTLGWMCNSYDIALLMAWKTVNYNYGPSGDVTPNRWETSSPGPGGITPGDGNLFYPGATYGLKGPCPGLRAMAWRDGVQDYDLIEAFKEIYYANGLLPDAALQRLYDRIFTGTIPTTDADVFHAARCELLQMIADLKQPTAVLYKTQDVFMNQGTVEFVCLDENATVTYGGSTLIPSEEGVYTISLDMSKAKSCSFSVSCQGVTKDYVCTLVTGNLRSESFESTDSAGQYLVCMDGDTLEISDAYALDGAKSVHAVLNQNQDAVTAYVAVLRGSPLVGSSFASIKNISFYVYNPTEEELKATVSFYDTQVHTVGTVTLLPGQWTKVDAPVPGTISNLNALGELDLIFEEGKAVEVYIDGFTVQEG